MKFLFPIVSVLISIALFFAVVSPSYGDISQLRTDVTSYNTALDNSNSLQKTQDALVGQYNNISDADKARLESFLPNTVNNIEFILEIEQIANLYNMPIKDIKFDTPQASDASTAVPVPAGVLVPVDASSASNQPYGTFTLEFTTEGTYTMFTSFLKDLEHNLRLVDVKSISFTVPPPPAKGDTSGTDPNVYTYTLDVNTYWLK